MKTELDAKIAVSTIKTRMEEYKRREEFYAQYFEVIATRTNLLYEAYEKAANDSFEKVTNLILYNNAAEEKQRIEETVKYNKKRWGEENDRLSLYGEDSEIQQPIVKKEVNNHAGSD